jgi:hypothetical protein
VAANAGDAPIGAHIASISTRAESDTERLISVLLGVCWPGGTADRSDPGALERVRRWGPRRGVQIWLACSCKFGRCQVCN